MQLETCKVRLNKSWCCCVHTTTTSRIITTIFGKDKGNRMQIRACISLDRVSESGAHAYVGVGTTRTQPILTLQEIYHHPWFELSSLVKGSNKDQTMNLIFGRRFFYAIVFFFWKKESHRAILLKTRNKDEVQGVKEQN